MVPDKDAVERIYHRPITRRLSLVLSSLLCKNLTLHSFSAVVGLTARVVAEFSIPSALPSSSVIVGKSNHAFTVVTASESSARCHQLVYLQVHDAEEVVKSPIRSDAGRIKLYSIIERQTYSRGAKTARNALRLHHGRF